MKILITGAAGFFGNHLVEHVLKTTDHDIVIIDRLTYASSGFNRLREVHAYDNPRVRIFTHDFTRPIESSLADEIGKPDFIIHSGAETHVDKSISDPRTFVMANVVGTMEMLEFARKVQPRKFVYFSTDEVFGPAPEGTNYKEWDRYNSTNPYSAAKAGGEELCLAYSNTFKIPMVITHTMNLFGERQHPEKFIPSTIRKVINGDTVIIHANKDKTKAGSRFYIHCRNAASAIMFLLEKDISRDKFNIVGEQEVSNLALANFIANTLGQPLRYEMVDFHSSRPGHDLRYALDGSKMKELGSSIPIGFQDSLRKTIEWTLDNDRWLNI